MVKKKNENNEDTYSYSGWLNSDKFLKRTLAVMGYTAVGTLLIYIPIILLVLLYVVITGTPLE